MKIEIDGSPNEIVSAFEAYEMRDHHMDPRISDGSSDRNGSTYGRDDKIIARLKESRKKRQG